MENEVREGRERRREREGEKERGEVKRERGQTVISIRKTAVSRTVSLH